MRAVEANGANHNKLFIVFLFLYSTIYLYPPTIQLNKVTKSHIDVTKKMLIPNLLHNMREWTRLQFQFL